MRHLATEAQGMKVNDADDDSYAACVRFSIRSSPASESQSAEQR